MASPQAMLDAITACDSAKAADDAALALVGTTATALTQAQADAAAATASQQQTSAKLDTARTTAEVLMNQYYKSGGALPFPPAPAPPTAAT